MSAKWRVISAQKLKEYSQNTRDGNVELVQHSILGLLAVAGWSPEFHGKKIATKIRESLSVIHKRATDIRETIAEGILSCDLELVTCEKSVKFDPSSMADYTGKRDTNLPGRSIERDVLCTVALGLKKSTTQQSGGTEYQIACHTLLKPQVVLNSGYNVSNSPGEVSNSDMQE